jgi:hypothetical protein
MEEDLYEYNQKRTVNTLKPGDGKQCRSPLGVDL